MSADHRSAAVAKEIRFSVVMYGGVSLAIYMNGVTQELLHMVRATARDTWDYSPDMKFRFRDESEPVDGRQMLASTEPHYRELANMINDDGVDDVRFIIDVISGTSAGGINGIFLAKALSDDRLSFDLLKSLWVNEGAIENLLNDPQSQKAVGLPVDSCPKSLLCSDRMYIKLLTALTGMLSAEAAQRDGPNSLVEELDLFATSTDINGSVLPLRLADMLVWEKKFRTDFHFHRSHHCDDFVSENNPFLAFVARCTSSFPFAFEPMQLSKLKELRDSPAWPADAAPATDAKLQEWQDKFFENAQQINTGDNLTRPFGDGGYLNNAPFSYVVKMLGRHSSTFPTDRKLIYVEPTPKHPEKEQTGGIGSPNAVLNSYDALIKLPGEQPIREDLQRVIERNRTVRKVQELSALVTTRAMQMGRGASQATHGPVAALDMDYIGNFSYLVLRVYATTDDLSKVIAEWLELPAASSLYYGLRCVVRAWRETQYRYDAGGNPTAELVDRYMNYVNEYDLAYEQRKFRFQRQQINMFYCFDQPAQAKLKSGFGLLAEKPTPEYRAGFREALMLLKQPFDDGAKTISDSAKWIRPWFDVKDLDPIDEELIAAVTELRHSMEELKTAGQSFEDNAVAQELMHGAGKLPPKARSVPEFVLGIEATAEAGSMKSSGRPRQGGKQFESLPADNDESYNERAIIALQYPPLLAAIARAAKALSGVIQIGKLRANAEADAEWARVATGLSNEQGARDALKVAECYRDNYELFDAAVFPLLYDTEVGTPELISIVRVSPDDARALSTEGSNKLAGTGLGHFSAFLDRSFRTNDILWGRLDGAERIVRSLISPEQKEQGDALIAKMQDRIIREFLEDRQGELGRVILDVARSLNNATGAKHGRGMRAAEIRRSVQETVAKGPAQLYKDAVLGYLSVDKIKEYLQAGMTSREPDRRATLESMTRGVRIVGGMLEGLSKETRAAGGFLIRVTTALWWLVEAAVPNGLQGHFFRKFFAMAFWLEIVMVIGGTVLSQPVQALGLKLLAFTALLWLVKDAFYRYLMWGKRGLRMTVVFVVLFILLLAVVMVITPGKIAEYLSLHRYLRLHPR